jgi:hypothetical protein
LPDGRAAQSRVIGCRSTVFRSRARARYGTKITAFRESVSRRATNVSASRALARIDARFFPARRKSSKVMPDGRAAQSRVIDCRSTVFRSRAPAPGMMLGAMPEAMLEAAEPIRKRHV